MAEGNGSELESLRSAFSVFDTNGDGKITVHELEEVFKELGKNVSKGALLHMLKAADKDKNGTIEFSEFIIMVKKLQEKPATEKSYTVVFEAFDKDKSGFINVQELRDGMKTLKLEYSEEEIEAMLKDCDKDEDGLINYHEFSQMLASS